MKIALQGLLPDELRELCAAAGESAFRGQQLWQWVQAKGVTRWEDIRNLPGKLKETLARTHTVEPVSYTHLDVYKRQAQGRSSDGFHQ